MATAEYMRDYRERTSEAKRQRARDYLGGVCVVCGTTDGLDFHHVDPSTKSFTIGNKVILDGVGTRRGGTRQVRTPLPRPPRRSPPDDGAARDGSTVLGRVQVRRLPGCQHRSQPELPGR